MAAMAATRAPKESVAPVWLSEPRMAGPAATPVAAGRAGASPAQTKMAEREAMAAVVVVQPSTVRLAMVALAAAAAWVAMGR